MLKNVVNFVGFQVCWWLLILHQNTYWWVVIALLLLHLIANKPFKTELKIMGVAALIGVTLDCLLVSVGVFIFTDLGQKFPIPVWLILLWLSFAATLRHSLSYLKNNEKLAILHGGIGGPVSYLAGLKFQVVSFGYSIVLTMTLLICIWACLMPVLIRMVNKIEEST